MVGRNWEEGDFKSAILSPSHQLPGMLPVSACFMEELLPPHLLWLLCVQTGKKKPKIYYWPMGSVLDLTNAPVLLQHMALYAAK